MGLCPICNGLAQLLLSYMRRQRFTVSPNLLMSANHKTSFAVSLDRIKEKLALEMVNFNGLI